MTTQTTTMTLNVGPDGSPNPSYNPPDLTVTEANTTVSYQLAGAPGWIFVSGSIAPINGEFSLPSISADGTMLSFLDLDTPAAINTFEMSAVLRSPGGVDYPTDPQIINRPG